jgi:hypothetical protein
MFTGVPFLKLGRCERGFGCRIWTREQHAMMMAKVWMEFGWIGMLRSKNKTAC